nr:hypothetical protein [uncultured Sphingomonas sp.]
MTPEILANFARFETRWAAELKDCAAALADEDAFKRAYSRIVSLQAWRSELLQDSIRSEALQFTIEGQNDLLVSYLLARGGQWRSALQSQRAAIENYLNSLYFMDHPVEMQLWEAGSFKTTFTELAKYFADHPANAGPPGAKNGLEILKAEYSTLSRAVHGSAVSFRMSSAGGPHFFDSSAANLGMWESRSKAVCRGLNLLLLSLFRAQLTATRKRNLRKAITYSLKPTDKGWVKTCYGITLPF